MLTGEFRVSIDDKGRVSVPSKLRAAIGGDSLYVTKGLENCLWLMLPAYFEKLAEIIQPGPGSAFDRNRRYMQRLIISPAQQVDIDRVGRINIPPTLRDYASLELKKECTLLGSGTYLELWNVDAYDRYLEDAQASFNQAAEGLSEQLNMLGRE